MLHNIVHLPNDLLYDKYQEIVVASKWFPMVWVDGDCIFKKEVAVDQLHIIPKNDQASESRVQCNANCKVEEATNPAHAHGSLPTVFPRN